VNQGRSGTAPLTRREVRPEPAALEMLGATEEQRLVAGQEVVVWSRLTMFEP